MRDMVVPSESAEQRRLVVWANNEARRIPALRLLYAVPNGGSRKVVEASIMKAEGVRSGVPDLCLAWPAGIHAGLYIELKRRAFAMDEKNATRWGTIGPDQIAWLQLLREAGHHAVVCRGADHAIRTIEAYLMDAGTQRGDKLAELDAWWKDMPQGMLDRVTKKKPGRRTRAAR